MNRMAECKKAAILPLVVVVVLALIVFAALIVMYRSKHPVKGDRSVQVVERRQRPVTNDPALTGDFPKNGWQVAEGNRTSPPQLPPGEDEVAEFAELYKNTQAPKVLEEQLTPGATSSVDLQLTGPSDLSGSARWIGTTNALKVIIALDGSPLTAGTAYRIGNNKGGSYLQTRTNRAGHATLSVTNTSGVTVRARTLLMAAPL
jgi:hypothetical protein